MGDKTAIEYADATWNIVAGCSRCSEGCDHCWAINMTRRLDKPGSPYHGATLHPLGGKLDWSGKVSLINNRLQQPMRWKKARNIFVSAMGDLFHPAISEEDLDKVFGVMLACDHLEGWNHSFFVLTKRVKRVRRYLSTAPAILLKRWARAWDEGARGNFAVGDGDVTLTECVESDCSNLWNDGGTASRDTHTAWGYPQNLFPLSNLKLGVSVENQKQAELRLPDFLQTPAVAHIASVAPCLSAVDFDSLWLGETCDKDYQAYECGERVLYSALSGTVRCGCTVEGAEPVAWHTLSGVIAEGESGHGARPCHLNWIRSLRDQCESEEIPFFFKQWGAWAPADWYSEATHGVRERDGYVHKLDHQPRSLERSPQAPNEWCGIVRHKSKKTSGRLLDGREHGEVVR